MRGDRCSGGQWPARGAARLCRAVLGFLRLVCILMSAAAPAGAYFTGPPPDRTGAPGPPDNGKTCNAAGCHNSFALNSGSGSLTIEGLPARYVPGQTYDLMVFIAQKGARHWGFEITTRKNGTNNRGGTLVIADPAITQFADNPPAPRPQHIEHNGHNRPDGTPQGIPDGPALFPVRWTAPVAGTGPVTFYTAGNAASGDDTPQGDYIYTTSAQVDEGSSITIAIDPPNASLGSGDSLDLHALVNGAPSASVAWELHPASPGASAPPTLGALTCPQQDSLTCEGATAHYTAPATLDAPTTVLVEAISLDDLGKVASAPIQLAPRIAVSLSPSARQISPGEMIQFTPTITGTANTSLIWSVQNASGGPEVTGGSATLGQITPGGLYTAPASVGPPLSVIVRARSLVNGGLSIGIANVTVADTVPPQLSSPQPGPRTFLHGKVTLSVNATDNSSVEEVAWYLDGGPTPIGTAPAPDPSGPSSLYTLVWDTTAVPDGPHSLVVTVMDAAGNMTSAPSIVVAVDNTPPVFRKSGFAPTAFVRGTITATPDVQDNLSLASVSYSLNDQQPFAVMTAAPYTVTLDTTKLTDGRYTLHSAAHDMAGNMTSAPDSVLIVDNTPPVASLSRPAADAAIVGSASILGTATDANFARYTLAFGQGPNPTQWIPVGPDVLQPVQDGVLGVWNTLALSGGTYSLRLTVVDQAGNSATETHIVSVAKAGDVVPDGAVTVADAITALQIVIGAVEPTPQQAAAADVAPIQPDGTVGDGRVTTADVIIILRMALGLSPGRSPGPPSG